MTMMMKRQTPIKVPKTAESLNIVFFDDFVSTSSSRSFPSIGFRIASTIYKYTYCNLATEILVILSVSPAQTNLSIILFNLSHCLSEQNIYTSISIFTNLPQEIS